MSCKICFSHTKTMSHPQHKELYDRCESCELITLQPTFYVDSDREKHQYDQHNNSLENKGYVMMFENFLDFFWEVFTCKTIRILDFGSGPTPVLAHLMQKRGADVACYDKFYAPSSHVLNETFDAITSTEVFEHLVNPKETLEFLAHRLNKGDYLALMTLFHANDEEVFWSWWYRRDPTHITFYTPKTLEVLANACGLTLIKHDAKRIVLLQKQ